MSFWAFLPQILSAGATIYGTSQATKASNKAANQASQATQDATNAQLAGIEQAKRELEVNRQAASPGLLAMQETIARGSKLNPEQEQAVADSRNQGLNALRGSSLRGSARATSAIVNDVDTRQRNNFMATNQQRADNAATQLGGQYFNAGNSIANAATQSGSALSQGLINVGTTQAANTLGTGALKGQAIGDIGAIIADATKERIGQSRDSSYGAYAPQRQGIDQTGLINDIMRSSGRI
jgi:hypothetical protein